MKVYLAYTAVCDDATEVEPDAVVLEVLLQVTRHHAAVVHVLLHHQALSSPQTFLVPYVTLSGPQLIFHTFLVPYVTLSSPQLIFQTFLVPYVTLSSPQIN
jgi:hypothetical protein